jgi:DNA repair protein RecO (recombination protein O)
LPRTEHAQIVEITPAILLRKTKLSDTSWIISWYTRDAGKLKTVAKGARRPKSPFAGLLDLFYDAEIQFIRSRRSELHTLKELTLRNAYAGLRERYERLELASYFVELIELATEPEHPAPELYDLLVRAFGYLETGTPSRRVLTHFEAELARLLGIQGSGAAHLSIGRVYHHLPNVRPALWQRLGESA